MSEYIPKILSKLSSNFDNSGKSVDSLLAISFCSAGSFTFARIDLIVATSSCTIGSLSMPVSLSDILAKNTETSSFLALAAKSEIL